MATPTVVTPQPVVRPLIAPLWHTIGFITIFVGLAVSGGFFQHAAHQHPQAVGPGNAAVPRYVSVIVFEWLLVLYVRMGIRKRGGRLRDLLGSHWSTLTNLLRDIALGAALWALWLGIQKLHFFGNAPNAAQGLLPNGLLESLVWLPVAVSAGFCEELAFRGYLQKQFQVITRNATIAVLLQGFIFGVGHLYEGPAAVGRIILFGVLYGLVAQWRNSLRPGMLAHAWSDICGVIIFRGL